MTDLMDASPEMPTRHAGSVRISPWLAGEGLIARLNTRWHERALWAFSTLVGLHWLEHLVQAYQVWILDWTRPESKGLLGVWIPWLVTSEALHFGFAVSMFAFFVILLPGFFGRSHTWWLIATLIQGWHLFEHALLQGQALVDSYLFGEAAPQSVAQYWVPRVELHLFYNLIVFLPMVVAMWFHIHPREDEPLVCSCANTD